MDINKFFQSKAFKIILISIGALAAVLLVFRLGMLVGFRKAGFSFQWGENYYRNFGGSRGPLNDFVGGDFIGGHGVSGQIIKINGQSITIKGQDNIEKIILIKDNASIMRFRESIGISDMKVDEHIVVIGQPNDAGQIEAKFIRILPEPGMMPPSPGKNIK